MSTEDQQIDTKPAAPIETTAKSTEEVIARLCHIIKRPDFDGYGFNLHSEKGKPGQYIGKVDSDSPAEYSGMREGNRILEVNGVNIGSETHKQVVQRIKAMANEVRLLVVDNGVEVTKNNEIVNRYVIRESSSAANHNNNTNTNPQQNETPLNNCDNNNVNNNTSTPSSPCISVKSDSNKSDIINNNHTARSDAVQSNGQQKHQAVVEESDTKIATTNPPVVPVAKSVSPNIGTKAAVTSAIPPQPADLPNMSSLNLKMSAAEMRSRLKKKHDPKRDSVDLKSKYDIIQKL